MNRNRDCGVFALVGLGGHARVQGAAQLQVGGTCNATGAHLFEPNWPPTQHSSATEWVANEREPRSSGVSSRPKIQRPRYLDVAGV